MGIVCVVPVPAGLRLLNQLLVVAPGAAVRGPVEGLVLVATAARRRARAQPGVRTVGWGRLASGNKLQRLAVWSQVLDLPDRLGRGRDLLRGVLLLGPGDERGVCLGSASSSSSLAGELAGVGRVSLHVSVGLRVMHVASAVLASAKGEKGEKRCINVRLTHDNQQDARKSSFLKLILRSPLFLYRECKEHPGGAASVLQPLTNALMRLLAAARPQQRKNNGLRSNRGFCIQRTVGKYDGGVTTRERESGPMRQTAMMKPLQLSTAKCTKKGLSAAATYLALSYVAARGEITRERESERGRLAFGTARHGTRGGFWGGGRHVCVLVTRSSTA